VKLKCAQIIAIEMVDVLWEFVIVNRILQEKIAVSKIVLIIVMEMDNVLMDNVNAKMVFQEYHATKKAV